MIAEVCLRLSTIKGVLLYGGGRQQLCEVAGYWQEELEHAILYADSEHSKHARWVTCPVSMLAMQELGCFQFPGIVYRSLQHGAVQSCWILAGTGTRYRICRFRAFQTCSMGDMSGEYAGHARTGMFSVSRNCVQILATWGCALSCCNMR